MKRTTLQRILIAASVVMAAAWARGAEQVLVVGDSLTKEYQVEFPLLYPGNPASWAARNWAELLHAHRNAQFDLGSSGFFPDPRLSGHRYNWAFPGATTQEIRDQLASTAVSDLAWHAEFQDQVQNVVERVVVFAGGNDVDDYYDDIYNGASA